MTQEADIIYEAGDFWVCRATPGYTVYRSTHSPWSIPDSTYPPDASGLSLARARCDYLANQKQKET